MRTITLSQPSLHRQLLIVAAVLALAPALTFGADRTQRLFDGKDLAGWRTPTGTWSVVKEVSLDPTDPKKLVIVPGQGVMLNSATNHTVVVPRQARDVRIEETPLETCQYYPVGERVKALKSHPTKD